METFNHYPVVMLALPKHDDAFTSTPYQLAIEFSKDREVWYMSHPYTWIDFFKSIHKLQAWKRFWASFSPKLIAEKAEASDLKILYLPLILPINGFKPGRVYDFLSEMNHWWISKSIRKLLKQEKLGEYVFINSHDFYLGRIDKWLPKPKLNIYHCIDPIIKTYSARHGNYLEAAAASNADLVISTSPFLQKKMSNYHAKSYCIPNAANFSLSFKATLDNTCQHPEIHKIQGLKVGYIGNIERRINYGWLKEIFKRRKDWQLVMVGPKSSQFIPEDFSHLSNVHFISPVPHSQLPNVLKSFDVAIIPFTKDEVSAQIYPLKLFEYMGAGIPVVTTDFNMEVIKPFQSYLYNGKTQMELEEAIEKALDEKGKKLAQHRIQIASQNDWLARAKQFSELINEHLYVSAY